MTDASTGLRLASGSVQGERSYQQDEVCARELGDGRVLVALADGMGGHAAGDVASAAAVESLVAELEDGRSMEEAFRRANDRVRERAADADGKMGATLVAVLVDGREYTVANVGDSRAYLIAPDGIRQITDDHSFAAEALERGVDAEDVANSPYRDALTRAIGIDPDVQVDLFGPFRGAGDEAVLLCSDGLYKTLSDEDIRRRFLACGDLDEAVRELPAAALDRGSDDNISVALMAWGDLPSGAGTASPEEEPVETVVEDRPGPAESPERSWGWPGRIILLLAAVAAAIVVWLLMG